LIFGNLRSKGLLSINHILPFNKINLFPYCSFGVTSEAFKGFWKNCKKYIL